jgi:arylsulfatase A-like enzyme
LATCADITGTSLKEDEGEDSFSMLPLFKKATAALFKRKTTVHHSIDGSFAIRKGYWKMIFATGSGGWSYPKPGSEDADNFPEFQLYDLKEDPQEQHNLYPEQPGISAELKKLLSSIIADGRSTAGPKQENEAVF